MAEIQQGADVSGELAAPRCSACGQLLPSAEGRKWKRFRWGMALALISFIPAAISFANTLRDISTQRATGLGAVAGGFSEIGVTTFFIGAVVIPIVTIVLLSRSFSTGKTLRGILAVMGIAWSVLLLLMVSAAGIAFSIAWRHAQRG